MTHEQCNGCKHLIEEHEVVFTIVNGMKIPTSAIQTKHLCSLTKLYSGGNGEAVSIDVIQSCINAKQQ